MKKIMLIGAVLISSLGLAQSRLTIADYVLAMPSELRLVDHPELKTWIGNTKISENVQRGCAKVIKDVKNDYLSLFYGGCSAGSGDGNAYAFAAWRSTNSANVLVGASYGYDEDLFGSQLVFSSTTDGKKFINVTTKVLPLADLKNWFSKCKKEFSSLQYKIPQVGTSILVRDYNNDREKTYNLNWNSKTQVFVLEKGEC
jgi:hypothetical protein